MHLIHDSTFAKVPESSFSSQLCSDRQVSGDPCTLLDLHLQYSFLVELKLLCLTANRFQACLVAFLFEFSEYSPIVCV